MSKPSTPKRGAPQEIEWHHIYPRPEEVQREDVIRLGRHIHEVLHRQPAPTPPAEGGAR